MKHEVAEPESIACATTHVRITVDREELRLVETPYGLVAELDGFEQGGELGGPALPVRAIHVALPRFTEARRATVQVVDSVALTDRLVPLAPLQPLQPGSKGQTQVAPGPDSARIGPPPAAPLPFVPPREDAYARALKAPPALAELVNTRTVGLNALATVALRPVQLDGEGRLRLVTAFVVEIELAPAPGLPSRSRAALRKGRPQPAEITSRAQAERAVSIAEHAVVNPAILERFEHLFPRGRAEYLVITDNQHWDPVHMETLAPTAGDLVGAFQRLVAWKRARGLSARVVTITDIMRDRYGNFRSNARDLQEVLRNFLKYAHQAWGTAWVLLGGDISVVPVRRVAGNAWGLIGVGTAATPGAWQSAWATDHLRVRLPGASADHPLTRADTGQLIPHDTAGTSSTTVLGWFFTTDATYTTRSAAPTEFIRVNGPAAVINGTLHTLRYENLIPTDFYYASLIGPSYGQPGRHDWDLANNGIYGQHTGGGTLDGVEYHADVSVGRVPASTGAEADAFVDKLLAYEQMRGPDGTALDPEWTKRVLIAAANWGGRQSFGRHHESVPPAGWFFHGATATVALINLGTAPTDLQWRLFTHLRPDDQRELPYATSGRGWYFARSGTDSTPSQMLYAVSGMSFTIPIPTQWVVVRSPLDEELSAPYFILDRREADGSMADQEQLREQIQAELSLSEVTRLYEDDVDLTPAQRAAAPIQTLTEQRMTDALSAGPHFVSLSGHGWWGGCCGVAPNTPVNLTNGSHSFVVYADSCLTNEFNHDELDTNDAVSERLLLQPGAGAVGYIGSTRYSWIGVGDNFQRAFFRRLATTRHLGTAFDVRCTLTGEWTGFHQFYNTWTIFTLNLLGCPETPLWVGPPPPIRIEVPVVFPRRRPIRIPVGPDPWSRGLVLTVRQGELIKEAELGDDGFAIIDVAGFEAGEIEVVASAPGHAPQVTRSRVDGAVTLRGLVVGFAKALDGRIEVDVLGGRLRKLAVDAAAADRTGLLAALRRARAEAVNVALAVDHDDDDGRIEGLRPS